MWPFSTKIRETPIIELDYKPVISEQADASKLLTAHFKGEVEQNKIKFPEELGEEHPFNFITLEQLYEKFGFFTAVVDKYVDFVVGPGFFVKCDDERAKKIIEDFMRDINMDTKLRAWTKEALIKGNGFMELGGNKKDGIKGMKVLNANYMYVDRDKKGKVKKYNQYKGAFDTFAKQKVIPFEPNQMAHFGFNMVGDNAYGLGIGYPALSDVNNLIQNERDIHYLQERKANAPLHAKLGKVDGNLKIVPKKEDITAFGKDMENMSKKTNWATDDLVELKVVDFGNVGANFATVLEYDLNKLIYDFQIPAVLLGMANVAEGLANVQMDSFQRRIQSIQAEEEKIIEEKIFRRVLDANGFGTDVHVEFEWGAPSILAIEGRMTLISELIKSPTTSTAISELLEDEIVDLLKLDKDKFEELKEEEKKKQEELEREMTRPQPLVPGQNRGFPQKPKPAAQRPVQPKPQAKGEANIKEVKKKIKSHKHTEIHSNLKNYEYDKPCVHCAESFENITDISEWLGFNYKKYLNEILIAISAYDFGFLKGITEAELQAGYLTTSQINEVKSILNTGMKKGLSMREMSKLVDKKVGLKDLYRMTDKNTIKLGASGLPILSKTSEKRSEAIIRSEVTRVSNMGAVEYYKKNGVKKVQWIASIGDRTCPDCESLDGQIYEINNPTQPPLHPLCRCTLSPVVELK